MKLFNKIFGLVFIGVSSMAFGMEFYLPQELILELEMKETKPVKPSNPVTSVAPVTKKSLILKENKITSCNSLCEKNNELRLSPERFSLKTRSKSFKVKPTKTEMKPEVKKSVVIPSLKKGFDEHLSQQKPQQQPLSSSMRLSALLEMFVYRGMITKQEYLTLLEQKYTGLPLINYLDQKLVFKKIAIYNDEHYWHILHGQMNRGQKIDTQGMSRRVALLSPLSEDKSCFYAGQEKKIVQAIKSFLQDMDKNIKNVETDVIEKITPREKYTASGFLDYCFESQEHNSVSEEDVSDENNTWADTNISFEHSSLDEQSSLEKSILDEKMHVYNKRAASVQKVIMYFDDKNLFDDKTALFFAEEENLRLFIDHVIDIQKCELFDTYNDCIDTFAQGKATDDDQMRYNFYRNAIDEILYEFMEKQPVYEYYKEMSTIMRAVALVLPLLDQDSASCFANLSCVKAFTTFVMKKNGWICFEQFWNEYQECDVTSLSISDYDMYEKRRDFICVVVNDFFKTLSK